MAVDAFTMIEALRAKLATVPGVATCKVGLEANMTPADYPMVRVVPSRLAPGQVVGMRQADVLIYFGQPIHEFTAGLGAQYQALLDMERQLIEAAQATPGASFTYQETVLDEDRIDAYKLMAIRGRLDG